MIRTRVGYTGGTKTNPTYYDLGHHTEAFQVDYDPQQLSYESLLALFWEGHYPFNKARGTQYKPVAFYHDEQQQRLAKASKKQLEAKTGNKVYTEIRPLKVFYRAEDYHQKYALRYSSKLMAELETIYTSDREFVDSTLAARLNCYTAHHGFAAVLEHELASYGLGNENTAYLEELAASLDEGAGGAACKLAQSP